MWGWCRGVQGGVEGAMDAGAMMDGQAPAAEACWDCCMHQLLLLPVTGAAGAVSQDLGTWWDGDSCRASCSECDTCCKQALITDLLLTVGFMNGLQSLQSVPRSHAICVGAM
jgi:hypothetical protein